MKRFTLIGMLVALVLFGAAIARGEISKNENLLVSFNGRFLPHALPRNRDAPVTISLNGEVKTTDGTRPPQLRRISIAVNRYGRLFTKGLPICRAGLLESTDAQIALARCGGALVGHGHFGAHLEFPNTAPFPVEGTTLAFNGRAHGRPAILLHIHGSNPVEVTVVLTFEIRHRPQGKFGTVFTTKIPRIAADLGYVSNISLEFGRKYRYQGKQQSFLSARCAAPEGFPGALFSFARGTFFFADGRQVTSTLARDCLVR
ncbi:MAG TPA: hypothetical protein VLK89_09770 [Solirubrobacterales bacterium]|nr:hypothetical protein [Solirubrobacterales bacterium]